MEMARALLVALACSAVTATRYADYGGGKMPEYGPAGDYDSGEPRHNSEDYHSHSPDAPASLDYKYEDQRHSEVIRKELDDTNSWSKSERHQKELMKSLEDSLIDDEEETRKSRVSHRYRKKRPKLRNEDEPRRIVKYSRDRKSKSNSNRKDFPEIYRDNFPVDKSKDFDEDAIDTTMRVRRRKPRDRSRGGYASEIDRVEELERQISSDLETETQPPVIRPQRPPQRSSQQPQKVEHFRPSVDDDEDMKTETRHTTTKEYDEYGDYYDVKRLNSIKEKLPALLQRRTTTTVVYSVTSMKTEWSVPKHIFQNRRRLDDITEPTETEELLYDNKLHDNEYKPSTSMPLTTRPVETTTSTTVTTTTKRTESTTAATVEATESREMSIAEKSRLSILKKAQRKEGVNAESTQKPPVLLQMRNRLHTVVMVEPPSSHKPWERVREVGADSPEHLERAKMLMRRKLVSEAKDIHELTDNWDEMICDYIDTALLESSATKHYLRVRLVTLVILLFLSL